MKWGHVLKKEQRCERMMFRGNVFISPAVNAAAYIFDSQLSYV